MAFIEMAPNRNWNGARPALSNTVKAYKVSGRKGKSAFTLVIARDVYARLGSPAYFYVMVGTGEHSGYIALRPRGGKTSSSLKVVTSGSNNINGSNNIAVKLTVSVNKVGVDADKIGKPVTLPFEVTQDGLVVDLRGIRPAKEDAPDYRPEAA